MKRSLFIIGLIWFAALVGHSLPGNAQTVQGFVPSPVRDLVLDVLQEAGISRARMMSRRRSTHQEAAFLYQLLKGADDLAAVRQRYGAAGQKVINAYLANKLKPRGVILARMDAELNKQINLLGESRREFTYVGPSKVYKFDIIPEPSMDRIGHLKKFETALQDHPDFRGWQGSVQSGGTYHINVPKLLKTITGLWRGRC